MGRLQLTPAADTDIITGLSFLAPAVDNLFIWHASI